MASRDYFLGKRVAIIGLGPHGEMMTDAKYLIKAGALVSVYDMKTEARVKSHIVFLRSLGLANYVCGSIPADDLLDMDLIILSHEYPRQSSFLSEAHDRGIPIEYPETLFFKLAPPVTVVGVMGARGKTTLISMLAPMLNAACAASKGEQECFVIDPESDNGILAHLKKLKSGDIVLARLIDDVMRELHSLRMSPHVAVFTTVPTKSAYDDSPFEILAYQTHNNYIVGSDEVIDATHRFGFQPKAKMLRTKTTIVPEDWKVNGRGRHDRDNVALALQTARLFKISDQAARGILESWKPLKGRLEPVKKVKGVEFYNDTASVEASSTEWAVESLSDRRNLVLIFGGADVGADYHGLYSILPRYAHSVVLLPGSGTLRERQKLERLDDIDIISVPSLEEATRVALERAHKGDKVLFSPGFAAGGFDSSRKERGERFVRAVRAL